MSGAPVASQGGSRSLCCCSKPAAAKDDGEWMEPLPRRSRAAEAASGGAKRKRRSSVSRSANASSSSSSSPSASSSSSSSLSSSSSSSSSPSSSPAPVPPKPRKAARSTRKMRLSRPTTTEEEDAPSLWGMLGLAKVRLDEGQRPAGVHGLTEAVEAASWGAQQERRPSALRSANASSSSSSSSSVSSSSSSSSSSSPLLSPAPIPPRKAARNTRKMRLSRLATMEEEAAPSLWGMLGLAKVRLDKGRRSAGVDGPTEAVEAVSGAAQRERHPSASQSANASSSSSSSSSASSSSSSSSSTSSSPVPIPPRKAARNTRKTRLSRIATMEEDESPSLWGMLGLVTVQLAKGWRPAEVDGPKGAAEAVSGRAQQRHRPSAVFEAQLENSLNVRKPDAVMTTPSSVTVEEGDAPSLWGMLGLAKVWPAKERQTAAAEELPEEDTGLDPIAGEEEDVKFSFRYYTAFSTANLSMGSKGRLSLGHNSDDDDDERAARAHRAPS